MDVSATPPLTKPRLRGILHLIGFVVAVVLAPVFIVAADGHRLVSAVFALSVAACFGTSALYHVRTWTPRLRLVMRRLDHAGVYLLIAGSYTPVALLVLQGAWRPTILTIVWAGAVVAIVTKVMWVEAPNWLAAATGIALGWVAIVALPQLVERLEPVAVGLLVAGGVAYTVGAIVYARRRPDPVPHVFGYHEVFHALTIVAIACHYVAIAFFVVDAA
jgi:hemolysin III